MKFKLTMDGRIKNIKELVNRLTFMVSDDAVVLASEIQLEEFDLSQALLLGSSSIKTISKENPGMKGALTLSPPRKVLRADFSKAGLKLVDVQYLGEKTVVILDDDTYFSVYFRAMFSYGLLEEVNLNGYSLVPYENVRIMRDGLVYIKETGHFCNMYYSNDI